MGNEKEKKAIKLSGEALRLYKQITTFVIDVKTIQGTIPLNSSKVVVRDDVLTELLGCERGSAKNYWGTEETHSSFSDKAIQLFNKNVEAFFEQIPQLQVKLNDELKEAQIRPKAGHTSYTEIKKQLSIVDEFPIIKAAYENWKKLQFGIDASLQNIEICLGNFFRAISEREAEKIWIFMSDDFKRRSIGEHNKEKYREIFEADTLPSKIFLDHITVLNQHKIECIASCEINVGRLKSLQQVKFKDHALENIGEIGSLVQNVFNQMKEHATEEQKEMMQRVSLSFDAEGDKWRWSGFRLNNLDVADLVLDPFKEVIIRIYEFSFVQINDTWLVDNVLFQSEAHASEEEKE
ncbi:hypothetical protein F0L74_16670 [Chitinophaga agrisoli]|uniref:Uncharacterized protein n=1 Tax=Chitinophaga agrisoli TaxID=2607653 RepID=A0A5B2VSB5_9BACT|nr:hypothetical protein [Chitinophaga agrisoli]KAA2241528.1 hypothetical protein F0L74_16670 [Chitinophaga agrisoli]